MQTLHAWDFASCQPCVCTGCVVAVHVQASRASCPHPPPCVARVHTSLLPPSTLTHPPLQVTYQLKCPTNGGYLFDFILSLDGKESKHRVVVGKGERLP